MPWRERSVTKSRFCVLDDPFSALDRRTEKQVFEHVKAYSKDRIVFLISHRLYLFPELDQVIWMDRKMGVCKSHERMMAENLQYAETLQGAGIQKRSKGRMQFDRGKEEKIIARKKRISAASIMRETITREKWLSIGIGLTVMGAVAVSMLPPLVLGRSLTGSPMEIFRDFPWRQSIFC